MGKHKFPESIIVSLADEVTDNGKTYPVYDVSVDRDAIPTERDGEHVAIYEFKRVHRFKVRRELD